jgi:N-acetylmuramoyl-L-alanine amidase
MKRLRRPVRNQSSRGGARPRLIVLHTTEGHSRRGSSDLEGLAAWFDNPASQASAHKGIDAEGNVVTMVPDSRKAWTQCAFNSVALSIEQVGFSSTSSATGSSAITSGYEPSRASSRTGRSAITSRWCTRRCGASASTRISGRRAAGTTTAALAIRSATCASGRFCGGSASSGRGAGQGLAARAQSRPGASDGCIARSASTPATCSAPSSREVDAEYHAL